MIDSDVSNSGKLVATLESNLSRPFERPVWSPILRYAAENGDYADTMSVEHPEHRKLLLR